MFGALFLKEWKDKLGILAFGTGLLALSLLAYLGLPKDQNAHELLAGGLLMLFFPFMALLLGAGGFEAESRNDAWAYLFSRPVGKGALWAVKYLSLLCGLGFLWLVFLVMMMAVPGLRTVVEGLGFPVAFRVEISFLPWSLLVSLFFLTVAFSLSFLSGKWSAILFAALFAGLALAFIAYGEAMVVLGVLRDEWFDEEKWLHAFRWGLVLLAAAFAGASVLTFTRADFSQPRKKIARFAKLAVPFLAGAVVITAAWTALLPRSGLRHLWLAAEAGGESYFITEQGIFKYNPAKDDVTRLTKTAAGGFGGSSIHNGKIAYLDLDLRKKKQNPLVLWIMNADGSGKTRLAGGGFKPEDPRSQLSPWDFALSPDGRRIVSVDRGGFQRPGKDRTLLWSMRTDGTDLNDLAVDPALVQGIPKDYWLTFVAWTVSQDKVLIRQQARNPKMFSRLWSVDLKDGSSRILIENAVIGWSCTVSPRGDYLAAPYKLRADGQPRLALLDLATLEMKDIAREGGRFMAGEVRWNRQGDKLAFSFRKPTDQRPDADSFVLTVYSVAEKRVLAEKVITADKKTESSPHLGWLEDGARLLLSDRGNGFLKILGLDLAEEGRIPFPPSIGTLIDFMVSGDKVLVADHSTDMLWRLDLRTESWKKIY